MYLLWRERRLRPETTQVIAVFGTSDYYLCVSPDRADLLDRLNAAQAQLLAG